MDVCMSTVTSEFFTAAGQCLVARFLEESEDKIQRTRDK